MISLRVRSHHFERSSRRCGVLVPVDSRVRTTIASSRHPLRSAIGTTTPRIYPRSLLFDFNEATCAEASLPPSIAPPPGHGNKEPTNQTSDSTESGQFYLGICTRVAFEFVNSKNSNLFACDWRVSKSTQSSLSSHALVDPTYPDRSPNDMRSKTKVSAIPTSNCASQGRLL